MSEARRRAELFFHVLLLLLSVFRNPLLAESKDAIFLGESLSGNQTLVSQGGVFEMGFFSPGSSLQNHYIGIWYAGLPSRAFVWVANRDRPVSDRYSSRLELLQDGSLVILDESKLVVWSANFSSGSIPNYTRAVLLDSGNLFLGKGLGWDADQLLDVAWQSFDHPTDTLLPGVKFNDISGEGREFTAWRRPDDPSPGPYTASIAGTMYGLYNGSTVYYDEDIYHLGVGMSVNLVSYQNERYFEYSAGAPYYLTRVVLDSTGQFQHLVWLKGREVWKPIWTQPTPACEIYAFCGVSSDCSQSSVPICKSSRPLEACDIQGKGHFHVLPQTRLPQMYDPFRVKSPESCRALCQSNCSCAAFGYDFHKNHCYLFTPKTLRGERYYSSINWAMWIRVSANEVRGSWYSKKMKRSSIFVTGSLFVVGVVLVIIYCRRRCAKDSLKVDGSLTVFRFRDLRKATKNFTTSIGEGGFGSVFKGKLSGSSTIAVKQLKDLKTCEKQFRAEVRSLATIHHANLIRLRGFCAQGWKRFLVFDYMPSGSLASHLFKNDAVVLDWTTRYGIAIGIAKGLAYLHEECRECIIHCDIKPENILLDSKLKPLIADFGLAKLVGREVSRVLTTIGGTRGYLAPEWMSGGAISSKVDVFSYGKLLFEIISGKRNIEILNEEIGRYFPIEVARRIHRGEEVLPLVDSRLEGAVKVEEVHRACLVACWCIQDDEKDRPTMSLVVQMLEGVVEVGMPPVPQFFQEYIGEVSTQSNLASSGITDVNVSVNDYALEITSLTEIVTTVETEEGCDLLHH